MRPDGTAPTGPAGVAKPGPGPGESATVVKSDAPPAELQPTARLAPPFQQTGVDSNTQAAVDRLYTQPLTRAADGTVPNLDARGAFTQAGHPKIEGQTQLAPAGESRAGGSTVTTLPFRPTDPAPSYQRLPSQTEATPPKIQPMGSAPVAPPPRPVPSTLQAPPPRPTMPKPVGLGGFRSTTVSPRPLPTSFKPPVTPPPLAKPKPVAKQPAVPSNLGG